MAAGPAVAPGASPGQGRLRSIDVLRGCAALAVVADHAFKHGGYAAIATPWFLALRAVVNHGAPPHVPRPHISLTGASRVLQVLPAQELWLPGSPVERA